ncbi:hypothetical protein [Mesorhizobium sp. WSM2239]|uniref:Uncharacterized protein n=2 Tax=unclassified Mesorhizobium TaxID=325217 RepID=A0AAU8DK16_9HYPH
MRLDVRKIGKTGAITVLLPAAQIGAGYIRVDENRRRFKRVERAIDGQKPRARLRALPS